jgi:hypothetical protein
VKTLNLPILIEEFSQAFHHTDPNAWIISVLAMSSLVEISATFSSHST